MAGNGSVICDAQGNMVAAYGNTALGTTQPGLITAGSDYAATANAQIPKVDAHGTQYVAQANPVGASALYYTGQPSGAPASQYGTMIMARQDAPAPSMTYPLNLDMQSALNVHQKSKQTFRTLATGVTCSSNKSIFSLMYASTGTQVLRINECSIYVPPSDSSGSLLGSSSKTYYALICELRRVTSASGGTALIPVSGDTADILTPGVTCETGATVGSTVNVFHRQDAIIATGTGLPWYGRGDPNEKTFVIRPGEGFSVTCISSGAVNSGNGNSTTTAIVEIEMTFTQAPA